ncbi:hypothetical protein KY319_00240 [Candidatus Woesearchaeota archaeon]|nr:hypothetical protein [Candidatus Woesearchaeota archaeon]
MRHVPVSIFGVVAIIGIAVLLFSVAYTPVFSPFAVTIIPSYGRAVEPGDDTVIVRLEVGEYLANELVAVGEGQLASLRGGNVRGKDFSSSFDQSIRFQEAGLFNGCHVEFGRDEANKVTDFLQCDDAPFKYTVDFSPGLSSPVEGGELPDLEDEDIVLLGDSFTIVDTSVNTGTKDVSLKMFGGFGTVELRDTNYGDDLYTDGGAKVNGGTVGARVKIKASQSGNSLNIYSIQYVLNANAAGGGLLQVRPLTCLRQFLQYPLGMLSPNYDICYKGLTGAAAVSVPSAGIPGNQVLVKPAGNDEYVMMAQNLIGQLYNIPLAQLPGQYGNKGRNFVFVEAPNPGAPNINLGDYFLVTSRNDIQGVSNVLRYNSIEGNTVYFQDLATGSRSAVYDPGTGQGQLMIGEGTYTFFVGAGNSLAMDQNNDGNINGGEANFVFPGGSRVDFGPGFTVTIITPSRLFDEPAGDEKTKFTITFGADIDLVVPSPQATVPGYSFTMVGEGGGVKKGMTKFGILFTTEEDHSTRLSLNVPGTYVRASRATGGGAGADVYITLERAKWMKPTNIPAPVAKCGDAVITKPEYCDPPGSMCVDQFKRPGTCAADCMSCTFKKPAECGNKLLENGEECETAADCAEGFDCRDCKCVALPPPVCGNNLLEKNEQCEADADCPVDYVCKNCSCYPAPVVEVPAPVPPNAVARFFSWLSDFFAKLF